jgi:hypothetical protein
MRTGPDREPILLGARIDGWNGDPPGLPTLKTRTTIMQRVLRAPIFWISVAVAAAAVVILALTMGGGAAGGGVGY